MNQLQIRMLLFVLLLNIDKESDIYIFVVFRKFTFYFKVSF